MSKKCDGVELVDNRLLWLLEVSPQQLKSPQKTKPRKTLGPTKKSKHIEGQGSTKNPGPQKRAAQNHLNSTVSYQAGLAGEADSAEKLGSSLLCLENWEVDKLFKKVHTCVLKARLLCTVSYVRPWTAARESVPTEPLVWQVRPLAPFDQDFERGLMAMTGYWSLMITYMIM